MRLKRGTRRGIALIMVPCAVAFAACFDFGDLGGGGSDDGGFADTGGADGGNAADGQTGDGAGGFDATSPCDAPCISVLAANQNQPHGVAADGTHVFWVVLGAGTVMKADLADVDAQAPIATGQSSEQYVASDATYACWNSTGAVGTGITCATTSGANPEVTDVTGLDRCIAVTGGRLYYFTSQAILNVDLSAPSIPTLFFDAGASPLTSLTSDSAFVYWTEHSAGGPVTVMKRALTGGGALVVGSGGMPPPAFSTPCHSLAVTGGAAYYPALDTDGGLTLFETGPLGSKPVVPANVQALAADSTGVYWLDTNLGVVMVLRDGPTGGSTATSFAAAGGLDLRDIAIDSTSIYWTVNGSSGTVWRATTH